MDSDSNPKLDELLELTRENNSILRGLRRAQRFATVARVLYWLVILGIGFGSYYYLQPYLDQAMNLYTQSQNTLHDLQTNFNGVKNFINGSK